MRATLLIGLVACSGCNQILGIGDLAIGDAGAPLEPGAVCFGNSLIRECPLLGSDITLSGSIDTDTYSMCQSLGQNIGPMVCVIAGTNVTIQDVTATGSKPLVVMAMDQITVTGTLDASSKRGGQIGAGANFLAACASSGNGSDSGNGGGGGAGGSFGGPGGTGGNGGGGVAGGNATGVIIPMGVRGGCPGARGGNATTPGADSGGAVYMLAVTSITLTGTGHVYANGAGGIGGNSHNGGLGAGSGGLVGLDAPLITLMMMASVNANGGGGGEGGSSQSGTDGHDGEDGATDMNIARGGSGGTTSGGDGGDGTVGMNPAGMTAANGGSSGAGGGGGGGGAGIVWVTSTPTGGVISPPAQLHP